MNLYNVLISYFKTTWLSWAISFFLLILFWYAGFIFYRVIVRFIEKWAKNTQTKIDDILIESSKIHIIFWSFLLGLLFASKNAPIGNELKTIISKFILFSFLLSLTFLIAKISSLSIKNYASKINLSLPLTSLTDTIVKLVIIIIGILILLSNLGISITPILTALGVGSLAVALALQDTLSNLFAGFHILASGQIHPGDYIKLESGQEGFVVDIGWRNIRIKELPNNIIIIPNTKVITSIIINYYQPDKEIAVLVPVGVSYSSDLEKVEKITIDTASEIMKNVTGGIPEFKPVIRYNSFGDSSIGFTVIMRAKELTYRSIITHEFIKLLHKRYNQEGIDIPFPQRVIHIKR